jgi:hypothetical protein
VLQLCKILVFEWKMDGSSCNIFEFIEVIGFPGDSSLLLLLVRLEIFCLSLGRIAIFHSLSLIQSLDVLVLMVEFFLRHYVLFHFGIGCFHC